MKWSSLKVFLYNLTLLSLWSCSHLYSGPAANAVEYFWTFPSTTSVEEKSPIGNLVPYKSTFSDPTLLTQNGYVDIAGNYLLIGSEVTTNASRISEIINHGTQLPPVPMLSPYFNLQPYAIARENGQGQEIAWVDMENQYAIIGGAVWDINAYVSITFAAGNLFIPQDLANYLWSQRKEMGTFLAGNKKAPKTIYIITGPSAGIGNALYQGFKPFVESGELSIHWGLSYFLSNPGGIASRGQILAILDGKAPKGFGYPQTPAGAFAYNEDLFFTFMGMVGVGPLPGGIEPIVKGSFEAINISNRTFQFWITQMPQHMIIVYQNAAGVASYLVVQGMPNPPAIDYQAFVNNVFSQ